MPELIASQHVSLVPGISRQQASVLRAAGITSWPQLKDAPDSVLEDIGIVFRVFLLAEDAYYLPGYRPVKPGRQGRDNYSRYRGLARAGLCLFLYLKALQQAAPETGYAGGSAAHNGLTALAADTITCDVLLDTVDPPVKSICTNTAASRCDPQGLKPCTTYYWRVVVKKACAGGGTATANGPVWSFTTASSVADLDKDCDVDFDDFSIFASEWLTRIE